MVPEPRSTTPVLHRIRDDKSEFIPSQPLPLKTADPPPDLLTDAPEDESDDLHALHDIAYRAAEAFPSLCG